jgi:hypothetical protein
LQGAIHTSRWQFNWPAQFKQTHSIMANFVKKKVTFLKYTRNYIKHGLLYGCVSFKDRKFEIGINNSFEFNIASYDMLSRKQSHSILISYFCLLLRITSVITPPSYSILSIVTTSKYFKPQLRCIFVTCKPEAFARFRN